MRILVTGSTDGIGLATAAGLLDRGHDVVLHGRTERRLADTPASPEIARYRDSVTTIHGDLASLNDVDRMTGEIIDRFPDLQILINNAGVMTAQRKESVDGYELNLAVNHLAHMLLTVRLVDLLRANGDRDGGGRIVNVASMVHEYSRINWDDLHFREGYDGQEAYGQSKVANVMFTRVLAKKLGGTDNRNTDDRDVGRGGPGNNDAEPVRRTAREALTVNALHPGVIDTKLLHVYYGGGAPPAQGARTSIYLATSPEVIGITGRYFSNSRETRSWVLDGDGEESDRLWNASQEMIEAVVGQFPTL